MSNSLVFVDLETTGLDPTYHEIIEWALIVADPTTLDIRQCIGGRVAPQFIERADPRALEINGYSEEQWKDAPPLHEAIETIAPRLEGARDAEGYLDAIQERIVEIETEVKTLRARSAPITYDQPLGESFDPSDPEGK